MAAVGCLVNETIDFEQSELRQKHSIRHGVDSTLDILKRQYDGMENLLTKIVNEITARSPSWARQYIKSCIFLPQIGFLLVVELDDSTRDGRYSGEGASNDLWEKKFATNDSVCYKTKEMRELDDKYGDIYCQIGGKYKITYTCGADLHN